MKLTIIRYRFLDRIYRAVWKGARLLRVEGGEISLFFTLRKNYLPIYLREVDSLKIPDMELF